MGMTLEQLRQMVREELRDMHMSQILKQSAEDESDEGAFLRIDSPLLETKRDNSRMPYLSWEGFNPREDFFNSIGAESGVVYRIYARRKDGTISVSAWYGADAIKRIRKKVEDAGHEVVKVEKAVQ